MIADVEARQRQRLAIEMPDHQLDLVAGEGARLAQLALVGDAHKRPAIPQPGHAGGQQQQRADQRQQSLPRREGEEQQEH